MTDPRLTPLAAALPSTIPFVAPERMEADRGAAFEARLGANELSFGPSPRAIAAMQEAMTSVWKYGVADNEPLRSKLADHLGIAPQALTIGEGIDGLLGILVRLYVGAGDTVVTSDGSYPTFNYHVAGVGGVLHKVAYKDDFEDPEALIERARAVKAKLVYLSNPNNPMGSVHSADVVQSMIDAVPEGCLLVLDEAYTEFAPKSTQPKIDTCDMRVIRFRTFSKAYGLAGARIGYGISHPEITRGFDKIRNHFGVHRAAQFGALAAVQDQNYLTETLERVALGRRRIAQIAQSAGLIPLPSAANFVTIDCGRGGGFAHALVAALAKRGVFVRMPGVAPLDRCIRVSVGLPRELDIFAERLPLAIQDARGEIS
jgi:histidinol-phosphate aminotransferase